MALGLQVIHFFWTLGQTQIRTHEATRLRGSPSDIHIRDRERNEETLLFKGFNDLPRDSSR